MPRQIIMYQFGTGFILFGFFVLGMYLGYQNAIIESYKNLLSLPLAELSQVTITRL